MTTRTRTTDLRQTFDGDCGSCLTGLYVQKVQSGTNDPVKKKAINPYDMSEVAVIDNPMKWNFASRPADAPDLTGTFGSCFGGVTYDPNETTFDSNDNNRLLNRLGDSVRDHPFNAASSIGAEGKEALEQIAGKTMDLYKGMRALKNGNIGDNSVRDAMRHFGLSFSQAKKRGLHKDLADRVLATQLGWMPLVSDIGDAAQAFHALSSTPKSQTYHASIRKNGKVTVASYPTVEAGKCFRSRRLSWTLSEQLSWNESLSLSNPWDLADAVYNATTLSFIVDWFIPIDGYLTARSLASTLKGSGYVSTFFKAKGHGVPLPGYRINNPGCYSYSEVNVTRVPLTSLSSMTALPTWKDFKSIPSWKRALTAVALIAGLV